MVNELGKRALRKVSRFDVGETVAWFQKNKHRKYRCIRTGLVVNTNVRFTVVELGTGVYINPSTKNTYKLSEL